MSRITAVAVAATLLVLGGAASATVTTSTVGPTTTYTENFNGGTSFNQGGFDVPLIADDYLWLDQSVSVVGVPVGRPATASWSFTTALPIASFQLTFAYETRTADTGFTITGPGGGTFFSQTLPSNNGTLVSFVLANPSGADYQSGLVTSPGAAGTYTLTFSRGTGTGGLKVDDLSLAVTAVPEPGSLALMLAGLGAVGFVVSRRRPQGTA